MKNDMNHILEKLSQLLFCFFIFNFFLFSIFMNFLNAQFFMNRFFFQHMNGLVLKTVVNLKTPTRVVLFVYGTHFESFLFQDMNGIYDPYW